MVIAEPRTRKARGLTLDPQCGASQEAALAELMDRYQRSAPLRLHSD